MRSGQRDKGSPGRHLKGQKKYKGRGYAILLNWYFFLLAFRYFPVVCGFHGRYPPENCTEIISFTGKYRPVFHPVNHPLCSGFFMVYASSSYREPLFNR